MVALVSLLVLVLSPLLNLVEHGYYDFMLGVAHDSEYNSTRRHPAVYLMAYMDSLKAPDGKSWTEKDTQRVVEKLVGYGASEVLVHPGNVGALQIPESERVVQVHNGDPDGLVPLFDSDGICRKVMLAREVAGKWKPLLPLRAICRLKEVDPASIKFGKGSIQVGDLTIPTDDRYAIRVRFRRHSRELKKSTEETGEVSEWLAAAPLSNLDETNWYGYRSKGRLFLIGGLVKTAEGEVTTALEPLPDFLVTACVLDTILSGWHLEEPAWYQVALLIVGLNIFLVLLYRGAGTFGLLIRSILISLLALHLCFHLFLLNIYVNYVQILFCTLTMAALTLYWKIQDSRRALMRFGGQGALQASLRADESLFDEVREKTATIVFTNVLDYLKELERYGSPEMFFERRQSYAQLLSDCFRRHGGTILDYQGDAQMVGFNVELRSDDPEHALHAVRACQEFLGKLPRLVRQWGVPSDQAGPAHCGICTGAVAVGHVGAHRSDGGRIAQAAIGDTSNVAARLMGAAKKLKLPIVMSEVTAESAGPKLRVVALEPVPLKGKTKPVPICAPEGPA